MSLRTMNDAADVYAVASTAVITWENVEHVLFEEFSLSLSALERLVADARDDEVWLEIRRVLRRVRSTISATPLQFNHAELGLAKACYDIAPLVTRATAQYSDEPVRMLSYLVSLLEELATCSDNPLGDKVVSVGSDVGGAGLLLPIARHKEAVLRFIRSIGSLSGMNVATPKDLADRRRPYAALLVVGSMQWYRKDRHVVASPRAHEVHLLRWNWMRDSLPETTLFSASRLGKVVQQELPPAVGLTGGSRAFLDGTDLVPRIDWTAISNRFSEVRGPGPGDLVEARVLMLADDRAVAVSGARGTIHVVEPELEGPKRIRESEVNDLEVGDFVLLRSAGGGDLVVEVADRKLGANAPALRALQREWKTGLRGRVSASTYPSVAAQLRGLGALRANPQNLRNWMSFRSLKTANKEDFVGIMKLLGREADTDLIWDAMSRLDNAHRRAGHSIRRMLIKVVADADLRPLEAAGTMEFKLPAKGGGRLTAFRVEAIAPDLVELGENRIGRLVAAGDLWLE